MPLITMHDEISNASENNAFSDLANAPDTVNHDIILRKLADYRVRGTQLKWFESYLENRQQCVLCNGVLSDLGSIKYGVLQGSNLSPFSSFYR